MLVMVAPGITAGGAKADIHQVDFVPTVLHYLGLPVAEDMPGRIVAMDSAAMSGHPVRRVPTYQSLWAEQVFSGPPDSEVGEEVEELLKSLGYVQ
jgi:hypothetical protein